MKNKSFYFFRIFLFLYATLLVFHIWETLPEDSWEVFAGLFIGAAIAAAAHQKHGYIPLLFLGGHLVLEWHHHGVHGGEYSLGEVTLHGIHAIFDFCFLSIEARRHYRKPALLIGLTAVVIGGVFFISKYKAGVIENHQHNDNFLHFIVLGGVLGCIAWHFKKNR